MPTRYATKKRKRRGGYRKRYYARKKYRRALRRTYVPSGLSTVRVAKVRFCTNVSINAPSGILTTRYILANSAANPTDSTIANEPMSWSLWRSMYQQYCVLGSKIMCIPSQQDTAMSSNAYCGVLLSERAATLYTNRAEYIEAMASSRQRGTWTLMAGQRNQVRAIKAKYSAKKWWNFKDVKDADDQWVATNSSPVATKQAYYVVWAQAVNPLGDITLDFQVIVDYIVLFREPINIAS